MKNKKHIITLMVFLLILSPISVSAFVAGGWSEETGYFTEQETLNFDEISLAYVPEHRARFERQDRGTYLAERIIATTVWTQTEHYTRAYYELWFWGSIEADSGRVWGFDVTTAYSGWVDPSFSTARSFYGR